MFDFNEYQEKEQAINAAIKGLLDVKDSGVDGLPIDECAVFLALKKDKMEQEIKDSLPMCEHCEQPLWKDENRMHSTCKILAEIDAA